jgi:hypothetical protein
MLNVMHYGTQGRIAATRSASLAVIQGIATTVLLAVV